jgi:hypothetical protein
MITNEAVSTLSAFSRGATLNALWLKADTAHRTPEIEEDEDLVESLDKIKLRYFESVSSGCGRSAAGGARTDVTDGNYIENVKDVLGHRGWAKHESDELARQEFAGAKKAIHAVFGQARK